MQKKKPGPLQPEPKPESPQEQLEKLQAQLSKLIHLYEQYFLENIKIEPTKERNQFKRDLQNTKVVRTQFVFQLGQIRQKFMSYCNLWDRQLQERLKE